MLDQTQSLEGGTGHEENCSSSGMHLKRSINLWHGIGIIVGVMVGSGIFISPKYVAEFSGSVGLSLIVWIVCGLISVVGAHSYTELGCMLPASGGDYEYILRTYGPMIGFLYVWSMVLLVIPASNAIAALTFAKYILQPFFRCGVVPSSAIIILASSAVLLLTMVNAISMRTTTRLQTGFTFGKIGALLFIVSLGIYVSVHGKLSNYNQIFANTKTDPASMVQAFYNGLYCYAGWNYLNYMAEEIKNPTKNLPRAIWIGMGMVISIFVAVNLSYFTVMSPMDMQNSEAVAVTFAESIYKPFGILISLFVSMSTFGFLNGVLMTTSRIIFAAARKGHMPGLLCLVNIDYFTPMLSLTLICILSILCICVADVVFLINIAAFVEYLAIFFSVAGLLILRRLYPEWERPIKVNLVFPYIFLIACLFILIVSVVTLFKETMIAVATILLGLVVYYFAIRRTNAKLKKIHSKMTRWAQLCTNSAFED